MTIHDGISDYNADATLNEIRNTWKQEEDEIQYMYMIILSLVKD